MTQGAFRLLALSLPQSSEVGHMGHPDFRVGGKIFATLGYPDDGWGMVKLTPEQQEALVNEEPKVFAPIKGAWGRGGATNVRLAAAKAASVRLALALAWRNVAPRKLAEASGMVEAPQPAPRRRAKTPGKASPAKTRAPRPSKGR
jgi:hypothetical protein